MRLYTIEGFFEDTRKSDIQKVHGEFDNVYQLLDGKSLVYPLPARSWDASIPNPQPAQGQKVITPTWELANNKTQALVINFKIGSTMDVIKVNPIVRIYYTLASNGSPGDDVDHEISSRYMSTGDSIIDPVDETLPITTDVSALSQGEISSVDFVLDKSLIAVGDFVSLAYTRYGSADTYANTVWFIMGEFIYHSVGEK